MAYDQVIVSYSITAVEAICITSTVYSVVFLAVIGHLDTRKSIHRVVALTFAISFAYSLTQVHSYGVG